MNFKEALKDRTFMLLGLLFTLFFLFKMIPRLDAGKPTYWPTIIFLTCILMNMLCNIYLSPFLKKPDERMRSLRSKAIFYSYFAALIYFSAASALIMLEVTQVPTHLLLMDSIGLAGLTPSLLLLLFFKKSVPRSS
ncbi:hypothetical protein [Paenibacillus sp. UNC499MF]|uniref:hypothetical protein n=1 Tax=Paenibacillus sp. UNC499MF TaxID=1502751 RepID=UPI00089FBE1F|nr:hypothetical protein [Paenibacillus sp. UNC499MF]SEG69848.1 hypothetical protein SAMN02799616_04348 [Paenibacillus sp. UNC499MF]